MKRKAILAAAAAFLAVAPAKAAPLLFEITGDYTTSFKLDSNPTPTSTTAGVRFDIADIPGVAGTATGKAHLYFYAAPNGGMSMYDDYAGPLFLFSSQGAQLYTGTETAPVFSPGSFVLSGVSGPGEYRVTISSIAGAVPEPASWALMIGGFGLAGAGLRRRQVRAAFHAI